MYFKNLKNILCIHKYLCQFFILRYMSRNSALRILDVISSFETAFSSKLIYIQILKYLLLCFMMSYVDKSNICLLVRF